VSVGPYTVIGPHVRVGAGTTIGPHCVIEGHTTIGRDNRIFQFNSIGAIPQDKKYAGEPCELVIGDRNTIREFCTFNIGSPGDLGVTRVGHDNWIMAYVHLAHDCVVGNNTIFANNTQLAGHVHVGDWVILGGFTVVHQFVRLGAHSMTAMCSLLFADLPPFVMCQGQPAQARSMNYEGLRRRGFSPDRIAAVKAMHKALYREELTLEQARARIADLTAAHSEAQPDVQMMLAFLDGTLPQRGIVR
jgi:UDP-N-acetylglucosamine acyltransferase